MSLYPPYSDDYYAMQQGWQCPLCKIVHAPSTKSCTCSVDYYGHMEEDPDDAE